MTENPGRIRALLDDTLTDEPPLTNLVPAALTGADRARRRGRMTAGVAAAAVLAVSVGAYGLAGRDHSTFADPAVAVNPQTSGSPTSATTPYPPGHRSGIGIPGLFDHPGTPQEQCAKLSSGPALNTQQKMSVARAWCVRALTEVRALLPDAVVVLDPTVDFDQLTWSAPLIQTADGHTLPGFTTAYQQAAKNPAKTDLQFDTFAYRTARGDGIVSFETTPPGTKAAPEPGGDLPLGDGTAGHFKQNPDGMVAATGVTATGMWYLLEVSGVYPVYGAAGSTLQPNLKSDGKDHSVFPDGYVVVDRASRRIGIPNPYTAAEIREAITARGLGNLVSAIGVNTLSQVPAP